MLLSMLLSAYLSLANADQTGAQFNPELAQQTKAELSQVGLWMKQQLDADVLQLSAIERRLMDYNPFRSITGDVGEQYKQVKFTFSSRGKIYSGECPFMEKDSIQDFFFQGARCSYEFEGKKIENPPFRIPNKSFGYAGSIQSTGTAAKVKIETNSRDGKTVHNVQSSRHKSTHSGTGNVSK